MVSVKIIRRLEKINERGQAPLYIRIIKDRKPKYISLGVLVKENEWDASKLQVIKKFPNSTRVNRHIAKKFSEASNIAVDMEDAKKKSERTG